MDDLSLRVYLENGSDAMRGGWLELPVVPERLDAFMRGVVGVDDGGGYAVVDHEPGWFGDVLGSDLESFSVSSLNLAARCVAHARDLAVADSVDGDVFLDMLATNPPLMLTSALAKVGLSTSVRVRLLSMLTLPLPSTNEVIPLELCTIGVSLTLPTVTTLVPIALSEVPSLTTKLMVRATVSGASEVLV